MMIERVMGFTLRQLYPFVFVSGTRVSGSCGDEVIRCGDSLWSREGAGCKEDWVYPVRTAGERRRDCLTVRSCDRLPLQRVVLRTRLTMLGDCGRPV